MAENLDLSYPNILKLFGNHLVSGRLESRAFLGWFLEHYYRLEGTDAQDAICDGIDDKGIDGIFVDKNLDRIVVFQTKLRQNTSKTLGDGDLKTFAGTLDQFRSRKSIENLANTTSNLELSQLLRQHDLQLLLDKNYDVRGVFITNVNLDQSGATYLETRGDISVYDAKSLISNWVPPGDAEPVRQEIQFSLDGLNCIEYKTSQATVFVAPLFAAELLSLAGLQSGELFAWNVRQTLGKTKVNKAIAESVNDQAEHKNFLLYHNGLTILTEKAELGNDSLKISGYTVVNGCQSLTTLHENRWGVSQELKLLTRIIRLDPGSELAAKITRHSNNQNAISARDLQSNSNIQRRLQAEFRDVFGDVLSYEIKRGEHLTGPVITNEAAARMLLAFDLQEPWACHQTYRLFDDLHSDIFARKEVDAVRIACISMILEGIDQALGALKNQLMASYTLTRYFMLYLLRQALELDSLGKEFVRNPSKIIVEIDYEGLLEVVGKVAADLIVDLNAELDEREAASNLPFDYKRELKSKEAVRSLAKSIMPIYEKAIKRNRASSFSAEVQALRDAQLEDVGTVTGD